MRDTVADMRRQIMPRAYDKDIEAIREAEERAEQKYHLLVDGLKEDLKGMLKSGEVSDETITSLAGNLEDFVHRAIRETRQIQGDAYRETLRKSIFEAIEKRGAAAKVDNVFKEVGEIFQIRQISSELQRLIEEGLLACHGELRDSETKLTIRKPRKR